MSTYVPPPRRPPATAPPHDRIATTRAQHRASATRPAVVDRVIRLLGPATVGVLLAVTAAWWTAGGGIGELAGWPSALASVGHAAALTSSSLLLVQIVLISRLPLLERAYGQDRLAHLHRRVGVASFALLLVHVAAAVWAHAAGDVGRAPAVAWNLTVTAPGMLMAVAGTVCLVLVVVSSIRAARTRLRYESWHLLHLYAYLGVGLALPHQLWTGREFVSSPGRTLFWWGLWGFAAAGVVLGRLVLPLWRSLRHRLVVTSVVPEGDGCVSVYMAGEHLHELGARAGHWFTWRFLSGTGWTRAHPYSLSAAPDGRSVRITVKDRGDGSAALAGLRIGTRVLVEGPYGRLTARTRTRQKVALIGSGVGMTPIRALAEELEGAPGDVVVLHRFSTTPLFSRELSALARDRQVTVMSLPGPRRSVDSWLGAGIGGIDDLAALRARVPDIAQREVFLCGAQPWTRLVQRTLISAGVPADRIHTESFAW